MASASERALAKELEIFEQLRSTVLKQAVAINEAGQALAVIDVACASAVLAAAAINAVQKFVLQSISILRKAGILSSSRCLIAQLLYPK